MELPWSQCVSQPNLIIVSWTVAAAAGPSRLLSFQCCKRRRMPISLGLNSVFSYLLRNQLRLGKHAISQEQAEMLIKRILSPSLHCSWNWLDTWSCSKNHVWESAERPTLKAKVSAKYANRRSLYVLTSVAQMASLLTKPFSWLQRNIIEGISDLWKWSNCWYHCWEGRDQAWRTCP